MKRRVSSTVTKRKANPRPRKYASASERQAAYRARAPEVCFRAEAKTVETLDRIAETLDQSRADVLLSMTKFALANHDWARFGLTHKPLPFEYGVNPMPTTNPRKTTKRKPTPAQLAARERFAEMARSGAFAKGRKRNPAKKTHVWRITVFDDDGKPAKVTTDSTEQGALLYAKSKADANLSGEIHYILPKSERLEFWFDGTGIHPAGSYGNRPIYTTRRAALKTNPTKKTVSQKISQLTREGYPQRQAVAIALNEERAGKVRRNPAPAKQRMGRIVRVDPKTGVPFGTELVPIDFTFKEWVGNYQQDFFARTEGAQLVVSEKTTGAKVGAVPFTLRSAALNDRAAAKAFVQKTVEKVGADRFNAAIAKAPKLTA